MNLPRTPHGSFVDIKVSHLLKPSAVALSKIEESTIAHVFGPLTQGLAGLIEDPFSDV
jgi:hypothetical protein